MSLTCATLHGHKCFLVVRINLSVTSSPTVFIVLPLSVSCFIIFCSILLLVWKKLIVANLLPLLTCGLSKLGTINVDVILSTFASLHTGSSHFLSRGCSGPLCPSPSYLKYLRLFNSVMGVCSSLVPFSSHSPTVSLEDSLISFVHWRGWLLSDSYKFH